MGFFVLGNQNETLNRNGKSKGMGENKSQRGTGKILTLEGVRKGFVF